MGEDRNEGEIGEGTITPPHSQAQLPQGRNVSVASPSPAKSPDEVSQMGHARVQLGAIWGPFTGKGRLERRDPRYLPGRGDVAEKFRDLCEQRFDERRIPGASYRREDLKASGVGVERRTYYIFQRGVATVAVYIGRFGDDLYVSRLLFSQGAISPLRVVLIGAAPALLALLLLQSLIGAFTPNANDTPFNTGTGIDVAGISPIAVLTVLTLPFLLIAAFLASRYVVRRALQDLDPLSAFRRQLNEFELDDVTALDYAVESAVRQSGDDVGIVQTFLTSPNPYAYRRRII